MTTSELMLTSHSAITTLHPTYGPIQTVEEAYDHYTTLVLFVKHVLHASIDYGEIPGTEKKPVLLLPGAEKLSNFFGLGIQLSTIDQILDWTGQDHNGEPFFYFNVLCRLTRHDGTIYELTASANSWEEKWRRRWVGLYDVPKHIKPESLLTKGGLISEFEFAIRGQQTTGQYGKPLEYWQAWVQAIQENRATKIKRKTKKGDQDAWEMDGTQYALPNERIYDQVNTIQAIAAKRAFVRGVNYAVGASQFFTSDMEKLYNGEEEGREEGEGGSSSLGANGLAETTDEGKQRLILELTRGVNGSPIWYPDGYAIRDALNELHLAYTSTADHQSIKERLIAYAQEHR